MAHPETGGPWWIPLDLMAARRCQPSPAIIMPGSSLPSLHNTGDDAGNGHRGATAYTLARKQLLRDFSNTTGKYRRGYTAFFRMSRSPSLSSTLNGAVWRSDMDIHILQLLRRRVCEDLSYLARLCQDDGRKYLVPYKSTDQLQLVGQIGCVLYVGDDAAMGGRPAFNSGPVGRSRIQLWACDLQTVLGEACVGPLRKQFDIFNKNAAILVNGTRTVSLQERLWKIQGYLNKYSK